MTIAVHRSRGKGDLAKSLSALKTRLRPSHMPELADPMLCTLVAEPFNHSSWIFEPKFDGLRVLGRFDGQELVLLSRNNQPQKAQFPDIPGALGESLKVPSIVDGEVVCFDERGRSSFRSLQQRFHLKDKAEIQVRAQKYPTYLYLFAILYLDGYDLTALPLEERKDLLRKTVR
jgi:ATP-dependent DNA ligase